MALDRLLSQIATQGTPPRFEALARWTEVPAGQAWDPEPEYGAFVDDAGRVVWGSRPCRAFLESDDPARLQLVPELDRSLGDTRVVFLDWGRQDLAWAEIFELWDAWEAQDMVADCGTVGVPWPLAGRWLSPGWIAFRGDFDGSPLTTVSRPAPKAQSFLARAQSLRKNEPESATDEAEVLPLLPFTLEDLQDSRKTWPTELV